MSSEYTVALHIFVTVAAKDALDARLADEPDAGSTLAARLATLSIPLSSTGADPPQAWGCSWMAMRRALARRLYFWVTDPAFPARANNVKLRNARVLTFDEAAAEFGLKRIVPSTTG